MIDWICRVTEVKHKNRLIRQTKKKCALKRTIFWARLHDCEQMGKYLIQESKVGTLKADLVWR